MKSRRWSGGIGDMLDLEGLVVKNVIASDQDG